MDRTDKTGKTEKLTEDNLYIKSVIEENKPFFIGRIAGCELKVAYHLLMGNLMDSVAELLELENNAGIKTKDTQSLRRYVENLMDAYDNCTAIAEWDTEGSVFAHTGIGQRMITNRTPTIPKINAVALEPYYFKDSWMPALKGKKILIVHPFSKTFQKQISQLKNIFPNRPWFEDCEFQFVQPPFTLAGNHDGKDWQDHLTPFLESLKNVKEFDIALVAAGGYGMLISNFIFKELQRSVIYIGGALQLFFGVIGKRWFDNKEVMALVNDYWVRPNKSEKPANCTNVERGCYW